jgi:hypothetical protein
VFLPGGNQEKWPLLGVQEDVWILETARVLKCLPCKSCERVLKFSEFLVYNSGAYLKLGMKVASWAATKGVN